MRFVVEISVNRRARLPSYKHNSVVFWEEKRLKKKRPKREGLNFWFRRKKRQEKWKMRKEKFWIKKETCDDKKVEKLNDRKIYLKKDIKYDTKTPKNVFYFFKIYSFIEKKSEKLQKKGYTKVFLNEKWSHKVFVQYLLNDCYYITLVLEKRLIYLYRSS